MKLAGSTALVTGANRGLGRHLAEQLIARGAAVYAAARNPDSVDVPGAIPITLDITDPASVKAAAKATGDVTVLINNAGSFIGGSFLQSPIEDIRREMEPTTSAPWPSPARSRRSSPPPGPVLSSTCCRSCPGTPRPK